jgi:hypothetical protein
MRLSDSFFARLEREWRIIEPERQPCQREDVGQAAGTSKRRPKMGRFDDALGDE